MNIDHSIQLSLSPSLIDNNLQYDIASGHLYYIHRDKIILIKSSVFDNNNSKPESYSVVCETSFPDINCAKLCQFSQGSIMVIADAQGLHFVHPTSFSNLHFHPLQENGARYSSIAYCEGSSTNNRCIFVGTSTGDVVIFHVESNNNISWKKQVSTAHSTIVEMVGHQTQDHQMIVISADIKGCMNIWNYDGTQIQLILSHAIEAIIFDANAPNIKDAISCLKAINDLLYVAYGSGHVRVFELSSGQLRLELQAHCRWIHAMDVNPSTNLVVTASEDCHVLMWDINDNKAELLDSHRIKDSIMTGVQLCKNGRTIVCSAYERNHLLKYQL